MGLDRAIRFPTAETPAWEKIQEHLARVGETVAIRMIDGMPAFPDEKPEMGWRELRICAATGMITLRKASGTIICVIWGNADEALNAAWSKVVWACASAGGGSIETPSGLVSAAAFAHLNGLSPA